MLKQSFKDQTEFNIYIAEQKVRKEKGYLTVSERKQLEQMLEKNYKPIFIKSEKTKLPIVTDINFLKKPCAEVTKEDNIKEIIQKLKDTLTDYPTGFGLSANQIGIQKRISYVKIPKLTKDKKIEYTEFAMINPRITEHDRKIIHKDEGCLSFPGIYINTDRWVFITLVYEDEKLETRTALLQDWESITVQHECDHLNGITIFNRKHKAR
jgi:peptide deformylase